MAANAAGPPNPGRWRRFAWFGLMTAALPAAAWGILYLITPRLHPISPSEGRLIERVAPSFEEGKTPGWPEGRMTGKPAVDLLLASLHAAEDRLDAAVGYSALLRKQERLNGTLGEEQILEMKSRQNPFAIYLRFRRPEEGKEVVYAEGKYDNDVVAHGVGLARRLIPRIKVSPTNPLAMNGNRHPVTDAGLFLLTKKLIRFREMDRDDPQAETVLDRVRAADGREWYRSTHRHPDRSESRPFQFVEVLYDTSTRIPRQISSYDWPAPGETGPLKLAERYTYDNLDLEAPLSDLDFDPANPAYGFQR